MTLKHVRYLKLAALVATLWLLYLVPWSWWVPMPWWIAPLAPTITSVAFVVLAHRLRVASWPAIIAFSLAFYVEGIAESYVDTLVHHETPLQFAPDNQAKSSIFFPVIYWVLWSVIFSPILLWGPILSSILVYGVLIPPPASARGRHAHR
jgi:hypothetical protein